MSAAEGIYRRVSVRLWGDEKVRKLSPLQPSGQALWLYLLTGPHTTSIPGVFVAGRAAIAEALDWEIEDFDRCLAELLDQGLVRFDRPSRQWFIPNAIRHNPPANPNVVTGWRTQWALLPEGPMRDEIAAQILAGLTGISEPFAEAFAKVVGNASDKTSEKASEKSSGKAFGKSSAKQEAGSRKQEAGDSRQEGKPARAKAPAMSLPDRPPDVDPQVWTDWVAHRKAKKSTVTATVLAQARSEASKAGMTLEALLREWCARGWQGMKAEWLKDTSRAGGQPDAADLTAGMQRLLGIKPDSRTVVDLDYSAKA